MPENNSEEYSPLTDKASKTDLLNINKNIKGLSKFIIECNTPMTISIQGEWGAGKSSIMKQIQEEINNNNGDSKISDIWFDTWQFSQFTFDDQLPIIFLERLVNKIAKDSNSKKGKQLKKMIQDIGKPLVRTGKVGINAFTQKNFNISLFGNSKGESAEKIFESMEKLKSKFESVVKELNQEKFIIYIDDLDRLDPKKAVELLEVLKVFLDVKKCVFVLAIDHEIVIRGVANKYKFDMNNPDEFKKGEQFFDKIIQVPYSVPIVDYDIKGIIKKLLQVEDLENSTRDLKDYETLIISSIGRNPRSIKRVVNMFKLSSLIKEVDENNDQEIKEKDANESMLLFMFTCMQNSYFEIYSYIINNSNTYENNIKNLLEKEIEEEYLNKIELEEELDRVGSKDFLIKVKDIVDRLGKNKEDILEKVANYSKTTYIKTKMDKVKIESKWDVFNNFDELIKNHYQKNNEKSDYPRLNREEVKTVFDIISEIFDELNQDKTIEYKSQPHGSRSTIQFKRGEKTAIADFQLDKETFSVEIPTGKKLKNNKDLKEILAKYGLELPDRRLNLKRKDFNVLEDDEKIEDFKNIIRIIIINK